MPQLFAFDGIYAFKNAFMKYESIDPNCVATSDKSDRSKASGSCRDDPRENASNQV